MAKDHHQLNVVIKAKVSPIINKLISIKTRILVIMVYSTIMALCHIKLIK